jgi:hypothetical protein
VGIKTCFWVISDWFFLKFFETKVGINFDFCNFIKVKVEYPVEIKIIIRSKSKRRFLHLKICTLQGKNKTRKVREENTERKIF